MPFLYSPNYLFLHLLNSDTGIEILKGLFDRTRSPYVESYQPGLQGEGGVTIIELRLEGTDQKDHQLRSHCSEGSTYSLVRLALLAACGLAGWPFLISPYIVG